MSLRTCVGCGLCHEALEGRFVGMQDVGGGEFLALHTCPGCTTTYTAEVLQDAGRCTACGHVCRGSSDPADPDPKIVVAVGYGPARVYCVDCVTTDEDAMALPSIHGAIVFVQARLGIDLERRRDAHRVRAASARAVALGHP